MSPLAKVFVVLIAVLNIAFLGISGALYKTQKEWRGVAEQTQSDYDSNIDMLKEKLAAASASNDLLEGNNSELKEQLAVAREARDQLQATKGDNDAKITQLEKDKSLLGQQVFQKDETLQQKDGDIGRLTQDKEALMAQIEEANAAKTAMKMERDRALLVLQQAQEENDGLLTENTALKEANHELTLFKDYVVASGQDFAQFTATPKIDGKVVAVDQEVDLIVLSVGKDDKVEVGQEFTVYRGGDFIAKAKIERVTADLAGARILFGDKEINVGDDATTRLVY